MSARPLSVDDLDEIVALEAIGFDAGAWDAAAVRGSLADPYGLHLGLRGPDGALQAVALGQVVFERAELLRILVTPCARRGGRGRALLGAFAAACAARGAEALWLEVRASNAPARALYAQLGMRVAGARRRYYDDGEDAILYVIEPLPSPALEAP